MTAIYCEAEQNSARERYITVIDAWTGEDLAAYYGDRDQYEWF